MFVENYMLLMCIQPVFMDLLPVYNFMGSGYPAFRTIGSDTILETAFLEEDLVGDLPDAFTICSSIFIDFILSRAPFIQMYKEDGSIWFNYLFLGHEINTSIGETGTYMGYIVFFKGGAYSINRKIKIKPHSWFHGCISLDMITKKVVLAINGDIIFEDVVQNDLHLEDKPASLKVFGGWGAN